MVEEPFDATVTEEREMKPKYCKPVMNLTNQYNQMEKKITLSGFVFAFTIKVSFIYAIIVILILLQRKRCSDIFF